MRRHRTPPAETIDLGRDPWAADPPDRRVALLTEILVDVADQLGMARRLNDRLEREAITSAERTAAMVTLHATQVEAGAHLHRAAIETARLQENAEADANRLEDVRTIGELKARIARTRGKPTGGTFRPAQKKTGR